MPCIPHFFLFSFSSAILKRPIQFVPYALLMLSESLLLLALQLPVLKKTKIVLVVPFVSNAFENIPLKNWASVLPSFYGSPMMSWIHGGHTSGGVSFFFLVWSVFKLTSISTMSLSRLRLGNPLLHGLREETLRLRIRRLVILLRGIRR